jgi:hypothetical protein
MLLALVAVMLDTVLAKANQTQIDDYDSARDIFFLARQPS